LQLAYRRREFVRLAEVHAATLPHTVQRSRFVQLFLTSQ
jgi:hypothetical protein